jgi:hypothetical protein
MDTPPVITVMTRREMSSPYQHGLPSVFHRVAKRGVNWGLPRRFRNYQASSQQEMSIGGAATKCFLSVPGGRRAGTYIAKFADKNGEIETYTELFNNQFGKAMGFEMAHSGVATLDGILHFLSRSFFEDEDENLIHGSLMVEQLGLAKEEEMVHVKTVHQQQGIYDIDFVEIVIREFCGNDFEGIFSQFLKMLVFDALIGSMDRHPRNWGVIRPIKEPVHFRFAPIYDSARALLWDFPDAKIKSIVSNQADMQRYMRRSSPRIGLPGKKARCDHFQLISYLAKKKTALTINALEKIPSCTLGLASELLHRWPFSNVFTGERKRAIMMIINSRLTALLAIAEEGRLAC